MDSMLILGAVFWFTVFFVVVNQESIVVTTGIHWLFIMIFRIWKIMWRPPVCWFLKEFIFALHEYFEKFMANNWMLLLFLNDRSVQRKTDWKTDNFSCASCHGTESTIMLVVMDFYLLLQFSSIRCKNFVMKLLQKYVLLWKLLQLSHENLISYHKGIWVTLFVKNGSETSYFTENFTQGVETFWYFTVLKPITMKHWRVVGCTPEKICELEQLRK